MHSNLLGVFFLSFFLVIIYLYIYMKAKYGFWIQQPVFHIYNVNYYFFPPGILDASLPEKNKFTNFVDITFFPTSNVSSLQWQYVLHMIRGNYLLQDENKNHFSPLIENLVPYFDGHNSASFCSIYYSKKEHLFDVQRQLVVSHERIIGYITSRPILVFFHEREEVEQELEAYYVDYLCVDKKFRKHGIAPELIQTHHYHQRHANKQRVVTIFKREQELTGIVPLCVYTTFGFPITQWRVPPKHMFESKLLNLVEVNKQNFYYAYDFIRTSAKREFDLLLQSDCGNLLELIKTHNIFLFMLLENQDIKAMYFYRKTRVFVDTHVHVLSCFASINQTEESLFINAFKTSFLNTCKKHQFGFAAIENISHNHYFIEELKKEITSPGRIESPTAYFFYNFAYSTFHAQRVLIIN